MSAHTKGPWRYERRADDDVRYLRSADGEAIFCDERYYPWCSANEADWPLIAAAPELLAALNTILALACDGPLCGHFTAEEIRAAAEAAIAKAEGKA